MTGERAQSGTPERWNLPLVRSMEVSKQHVAAHPPRGALKSTNTNLKRLAELTDGLIFELSDDPALQEVQRLVQRLTASMTQTLSGAAVGTPSAEPMRL